MSRQRKTTSPPRPINLRAAPRGRQVDPQAREQVRALLADTPRRRDLLIEHLHRLQDRFGCLHARHLAALAAEMNLALAEVYEVASFYHHFDVVKEGEAAPPALTVRVCDSIACELAGSGTLLKDLAGRLGPNVRVISAPCVGRCETAPVAVIGQNPLPHATVDDVAALVEAKAVAHPDRSAGASHPYLDVVSPPCIDYAAYRAAGGYALAQSCAGGKRTREEVIAALEDSGLRGLGGAGFPQGASGVRSRPSRRRGCSPSTSTKASPALSRTAGISSAIRTAFSKVRSSGPGRSGSTRSISTCATNTTAAARCSSVNSPRSRPIRRSRCRPFTCAGGRARTSAAKSRR